MFLKEHGTAALLLAAIFLGLGFIIGKVTSHHGGHNGCKKACKTSESCSHSTHSKSAHAGCNHWVAESGAEHMIIVESLMEAGFEGDTVLTIPGGAIHINIDGDYVNVEVEIDESSEGGHGEGHEEVRVIKVITTEEN
jgi:hypothetical protein